MSKKPRRKLKAKQATIANKPKKKVVDAKVPSEGVITFIKKNIKYLGLFTIIIILIYANSIAGEILRADDLGTIVGNPKIHNFSTAVKTYNLHTIINSIIYVFFGANAAVFHIRSILFHIINSFLIYVLIKRLFNKKTALYSTLLFIAHPANSEAVSWISGFGYLLQAFLSFVTILFFIKYRNTKKLIFFGLSVLTYAIYVPSLRTAWALTTPMLIIILDQLLINTKIKLRNVLAYLPHLAIAGVFAITWIFTELARRQEILTNIYYFDPKTAPTPVLRWAFVFLEAYKLEFFPVSLSFYTKFIDTTVPVKIFLIFLFIFTIAGVLILFLRDRKLGALAIAFFAAISPTLSPVAVAVNYADRYFYIATVFFTTGVILVLTRIEKKYKIKDLLIISTIILMLFYSIRSFVRTFDFKNDRNLWIATQKTAPNNFRVYLNLGNVYYDERNFPKAIEYYQLALKLRPDYADAVHNIAYIYMTLEKYDKARDYFIEATKMNPHNHLYWYNLGFVEYKVKNFEEARKYFLKSLEIRPDYYKAQNALAELEKVNDRSN